MPELPDVEIYKRILDKHALGHVIARTVVFDPGSLEGATAAAMQRRLKDKRLSSSQRHGKVLFAEFDGAATLAMHFGTNGALRAVIDDEADPPDSTRVMFEFTDNSRLAYVNPRRIGHVHVIDSVQAYVSGAKLGPDALDRSFDDTAFAEVLANRQAIKAVLMDQTKMAGIGNIYADEILFQARLHPGIVANALEADARSRLFNAMRHVLQTAIDRGAGAEDFTDRLPAGFLLPQRHANGHCPRCGTKLMIDKRGGRTSYHCPKCQPVPSG